MAGPTVSHALVDDLDHRLRLAEFWMISAEPIAVRHANNNRLLRLTADDGRRVIAKVYRRDMRRRLDREFTTLAFLRAHGIGRVPTPILRSDEHQYAVYSFEEGTAAAAADLTLAQVEELARFAADLDRVRPGDSGASFEPAWAAIFSVAAVVQEIRRRVAPVAALTDSPEVPDLARDFLAAARPLVEIEALVRAATADLTPAAIVRTRPRAERRLASNDFAPNNVLIRPDGGVCVIDFEYAGWDDPIATPAEFLTHAQSLDLGPERAAAFVETYRAAADRPDEWLTELGRACLLRHILWCAIHLAALDPAYLRRKRFATPDLDATQSAADHIAQFLRRVEIAWQAIANLRRE